MYEGCVSANAKDDLADALEKKGTIVTDLSAMPDKRCLGCPTVCEVCVDVCPNRANIAVEVPGMKKPQILHVDRMCNECGNCAIFCPYDSAPYRDKLTLFMTKEGFEESVNNSGFLPLGGKKVLVRLNGKVSEVDLDTANDLPADIEVFILTVLTKYTYLIG
jgi:putative selenate reductase